MRREGCDEDNLAPEDFLCDFCGQTWAADRPMVEGHRGSLACARCLTLAFDELWNMGVEPLPAKARTIGEAGPGAVGMRPSPGVPCTMCLEQRDEPHWHSPARPEAWICRRCAKQSVVMLERDSEANFRRPPPR